MVDAMNTETRPRMVYVVTHSDIEWHEILRVYYDREEARRFVEAYSPTESGTVGIEEWDVGRPAVVYDGPYWEGAWRDHFREVDGVMERYAHVGGFRYEQHWHTGDALPDATVAERVSGLEPGGNVYYRNHPYVVVQGTSRVAVEELLQQTAALVKAERGAVVDV